MLVLPQLSFRGSQFDGEKRREQVYAKLFQLSDLYFSAHYRLDRRNERGAIHLEL